MIIQEPADWKYYLKKITSHDCHSFVVSNKVMLIINREQVSNNFLAYQNGQWYGAKGHARGASQPIAEKGKHLFVISENAFWMMRNDRTVEYASKAKPLSKDAVAFLFAEHAPGMCLYAVDGSKHPAPLAALIYHEPYSADFAAMIVIALVRQHDPESAAQMEAFWFGDAENETDSDEDNTPPLLD